MAKCTVCNSRKGKRKCKATDSFICSQCCGESRTPEKCDGCSFFKSASANRNYRKAPHFTTQEMADSPEKEKIALTIEVALTDIWLADKENVNDATVRRLVEMLLDNYHFGDTDMTVNDPILTAGYMLLCQRIKEELPHIPPEKLIQALGAIYRSILRRSAGSCGYLNFISQFSPEFFQ